MELAIQTNENESEPSVAPKMQTPENGTALANDAIEPAQPIQAVASPGSADEPIESAAAMKADAAQAAKLAEVAARSDIRKVINNIQAACDTRLGLMARVIVKPVAVVCATAGALEGGIQAFQGHSKGDKDAKVNGLTAVAESLIDASTSPYKLAASGLAEAVKTQYSSDSKVADKSEKMFQNAAIGVLGTAIGGANAGPLLTTVGVSVNEARTASKAQDEKAQNKALNEGVRNSVIESIGVVARAAAGKFAGDAANVVADTYIPKIEPFKDQADINQKPSASADFRKSELLALPSLIPANDEAHAPGHTKRPSL